MQEEATSNKKIFEDLPVPKALATMAIPTIIGQMVVLLYNMADTFFIGQTGNPFMVAAASLILPLFNLTIAISNMIGFGGGATISRLLGVHEEKEATKVSVFSFWCSIAAAGVFSLLVFVFMRPLLVAMGASTATYDFARSYALCVVVLGGIPTVASLTMSQLVRAVGCSKEAGFGISMGGILNIGLDPLIMFYILPPGHEILGAGIATFLSNVISFCYFLWTMLKLRQKTVLSVSPSKGFPTRSRMLKTLGVGIPSGISNLLFDTSQIILDKLMTAYGDVALAAVGIVLKAERIPLNTGVGICQGMTPIVAYNYGAKNYKRMRDTINTARLGGLAVAALSIIFYELCANPLIHFFISDPQTVHYGVNFLRLRVLATPLMFMAFQFMYSFQAMNQPKIASNLTLARQLIFYIPLLFILNHFIGVYGLVLAQLVGDIFTDILSFLAFRRFNKNVLLPEEKRMQQQAAAG